MSEPVWEAALRTAASVRPGASSTSGLPASRSARAASRKARPSTTSSVYTATARVPSWSTQACRKVDQAEVRLVAERDEPGHAQASVGQQVREVEHQVAALAEHRHVAGRELGVRQLESGRGVGDPEAVGADQHRAGGPGDRQRLGLEPGPLRACLGESGGDAHDRLGAGSNGVGHRGHEAVGRHAEHGQVDAEAARGGRGRRRGVRGLAEDLTASAVDQEHGAAIPRRQRSSGEDVAPLRGVVAGAYDGDRARREEGLECVIGRSLTPHPPNPSITD